MQSHTLEHTAKKALPVRFTGLFKNLKNFRPVALKENLFRRVFFKGRLSKLKPSVCTS